MSCRRSLIRQSGAAVLFAALTSMLAQGATGTPPATRHARANALAAELDQLRREHAVPALALVLLDERQPVLVRGFGTAGPDTPMRWGSISKTFTALGALLAARSADVPQSSPIRPLLGPGYYVNDWAPGQPIRLDELLELAAGLGDLSKAEFDDNTPRPLWQALARRASERRTWWPPGLQHSYTNVAPGLTAAVIERLSGQSFEAFMRRAVLEPAGMANASFEPVAGLPGGFRADGTTPIPYWHMTFTAFGGLNASPADMARLLSILLNGGSTPTGRVFPADVVARLFQPRTTLGARHGLEVSYGAGSYGWVRGGRVFWGHGGDADGYLSRYGLLKGVGRGYAVIINTDNPPLLRTLERRIEQMLVEDLPPVAGPAPLAAPELDRYVGTYYPASARFGVDRWQNGLARTARVRRDRATLLFSRQPADGRETRLLPLGRGRFRRPTDPAVTVVFAEADGVLYLQGELGNYLNRTKGPCPDFIARCR